MIRREFALRIAAIFPAFARGSNRDASTAAHQPSFPLPYSDADTADGPLFEIVNERKELYGTGIQGKGFFGIVGNALKFSGGMGVGGISEGRGSAGVDGRSEDGLGVYGRGKTGVQGVSSNRDGFGVEGQYVAARGDYTLFKGAREGGFVTHGMLGTPVNGVEGISDALDGKGIAGKAEKGKSAAAVYGQSVTGFAGFFRGRVTITESLLVKDIYATKLVAAEGLIGGAGAKAFRIDHPLAPATKSLSHASIESDSMKNLYDGMATLDSNGVAWVTLPDWFDALNADFRYQLTCIGGYAPVYIAHEIEHNRFAIAGGIPGMKVSWQVTGLRNDVYARAHPLQVEEDKQPSERGKYWSPREQGFADAAGIWYRSDEHVAGLPDRPISIARR
jgi:hypothetical protein